MTPDSVCYLTPAQLNSLRPSDAYMRHHCVRHWLLASRRQAIIRTNADIVLIWHLGTHFSEILIEIRALFFKKIYLKMSSGKWRPFCLGLNVLSQSKANMRLWTGSAFLRCCLFGVVALTEPMLLKCQLESYRNNLLHNRTQISNKSFKKTNFKSCLQN